MKKILIALLLCASSAFAGDLGTTSNGAVIQGCNYDGTETTALTVVGLTKDNTNYACFSVYSPSDCVIRLTATSSKTGSVGSPIIGGQWNTFVVNKKTAFSTVSGCTSGSWRRNSVRVP